MFVVSKLSTVTTT